jgi:hypothetical protein
MKYQVTMQATFGLYPMYKQTEGTETVEAATAKEAEQKFKRQFVQLAAQQGMAEEDYNLEVLEVKQV